MISNIQAQQQAVVVQAGIVDGLFVDDQGVRERTDLQQALPITARAGQARDFQAQNGSDVAKSYFSHQPLKTVASDGRGAGLALILVNDLDASWFPSQLLGSLHQVILPGRAADVLTDLRASSIDARRSRRFCSGVQDGF
jgi:hypothetical protein